MNGDESFVVRIFRREQRIGETRCTDDATGLTGVIEYPGTGQRMSFHDIEELWATLAHDASSSGSGKKGP